MQILFGRSPRLADWEGRPLSPGVEEGPRAGDRHDEFQREVARERPGEPEPDGAYRALANAILAYRVFPPDLIEGVLRRTPVEVGDVVGIRYRVLPGVSLFFAARVTARFEGIDGGLFRTGFTYRTLAGHAEAGEETFVVEKSLADGRISVALRSWSRPGLWMTRALSPLLRRVQVHANRRALDHLETIARGHSSAR
jgi:hypothetical protein